LEKVFLFPLQKRVKLQGTYMNNSALQIVTLGPFGTFSELAADEYQKTISTLFSYNVADITNKYNPYLTQNFSTIFDTVVNGTHIGIIPFENSLDGYIGKSLDFLVSEEISILDEITIPISFFFVANIEKLQDLTKIYVQFKTEGQCENFIKSLPSSVNINITESNGISGKYLEKNIKGEGAILPNVPFNREAFKDYQYKIEDVTDKKNDKTRFIAVKSNNYKTEIPKRKSIPKLFKTSLVILKVEDKPGALTRILQAFSNRSINLTSIMSRPTKEELGKYHFFIDIEGRYPEDKIIKVAIDEIKKSNKVKLLGSYPQAS
jgi:prephenate dehydratase